MWSVGGIPVFLSCCLVASLSPILLFGDVDGGEHGHQKLHVHVLIAFFKGKNQNTLLPEFEKFYERAL